LTKPIVIERMSDMPEAETKSTRSGKKKASKGSLFEKIAPILIFLSIGLAFAVGVLWQKVNSLQGGGKTTTTTGGTAQPQAIAQGKLSEEQTKKIPALTDSDHVRGDRNADIVLIEYSDYQCPFCKQFHPTMQKVLDEYGDKVAWVYRHFPLDQIHPKARPSAEASECVAELGGEDAFWAFTDTLFADQTKLDDLAAAAVSAGVSKSAFEACVASGRAKDKVEESYQGGITAGITGTPGNLVLNSNGGAWLIPGALPFESVKATIEEALKG
jgi:protein-disulfide isomerase